MKIIGTLCIVRFALSTVLNNVYYKDLLSVVVHSKVIIVCTVIKLCIT